MRELGLRSIIVKKLNRRKKSRKWNDISFRFRKSIYIKWIWEFIVEKNVKHSYSKKGYPYDNASMESFNTILKKEEVNVNTYETFNEARLAIFEFIEGWYNNIFDFLMNDKF